MSIPPHAESAVYQLMTALGLQAGGTESLVIHFDKAGTPQAIKPTLVYQRVAEKRAQDSHMAELLSGDHDDVESTFTLAPVWVAREAALAIQRRTGVLRNVVVTIGSEQGACRETDGPDVAVVLPASLLGPFTGTKRERWAEIQRRQRVIAEACAEIA